MANIHPLACVDPGAEIASDVVVGPFCLIEKDVQIGAGTVLDSHVTIKSGSRIGTNNQIGQGVVIGSPPQDRKYAGEPSYAILGNDNIIREHCTIHRATGEGKATRVGNDCFLMIYVHLGHNVTVHDKVTMAGYVGLAGHATVEQCVTFGGFVAIHQFARVGQYTMVGGFTRVSRDVPPYVLVAGMEQDVVDINAVGLRRAGITPDGRMALHKAIKLLFKSELGLSNAIETVRREVPLTDEVQYLLAFEERR